MLKNHLHEANITLASDSWGSATKEFVFDHWRSPPDMYIDTGELFIHVHRSMLGRYLFFQPLRTFFHLVEWKPKKLDWYNDYPIWSHGKVSERQWELVLDLIYYP